MTLRSKLSHGSDHEYLQEMNREVLSKYDVMTVGEAFGDAADADAVDERRNELNMIFNFDAAPAESPATAACGATGPCGAESDDTTQDKALDVHSWNTVFLSNHDNPRVVSAFGDDSPGFRVPSDLLATMLLTLKGTPFIYQGDELGMTSSLHPHLEEFDDIEVKNGWKADVLTGRVKKDDYIANLRKTSRDNSRTRMQWDSSPNAGFTTAAKPWLAVNPNYKRV